MSTMSIILKLNILVFLLLSPLLANDTQQHIPIEKLMQIKESIYRFHFDSAQIQIQKNLQQRPEDLSLNFYDAFIDFMGFSQDVTRTYLEPVLLKKIERTIAISDSLLQEDDENVEALYYKALVLGLKGLYHVVRDEYISAYWYGGDGIKLLEEVVEKKPDFTDAYLGLGLFHYYIDLMPGLVKFFAAILGYSGSREEGLKEIELVANNGVTFKIEARFALGSLNYFVENDLQKGLYWFGLLEKEYPNNPLVNLMYGIYYRRKNDISKSKYYTKKVLNPNQYGRFGSLLHGAYYNYGQCFFVENKIDSAYSVFKTVDGIATRKSTYFRATIKFWLGYLSELEGNRKKALIYYNFVQDNSITRRWYDYVKNLLQNPLTKFEIKAIYTANQLKLDSLNDASIFIEKNKKYLEKLSYRERGRFFHIEGNYFSLKGDYLNAVRLLRKARENYLNAAFEPMVAAVDYEILNHALDNDDVETAEEAYDNASDYKERYFQIKLRKLWSVLEKKKADN